MVKEKRKIPELYVGDFILFNGKVCIVIEKSITNSSIRVLNEDGQTYLIVNNDTEFEKLFIFELDLEENPIISKEKFRLLSEYVEKRKEYEVKLKFLNYYRKEVQELGSEIENYFEKLRV